MCRVLGFQRVAPVVGRSFSMTKELKTLCNKDFTKTMFRLGSEYGVCLYFKENILHTFLCLFKLLKC